MKTEQMFEQHDPIQLDNKITISFERQKIEVPLNFEVPKDRIMYNLFCELRDKVNSLETELKKERLFSSSHIERKMSDTKAKEEILDYIKQLKQEGFKKVSIIDLVDGLNLPTEQIEKIMDALEGVNVNGKHNKSAC